MTTDQLISCGCFTISHHARSNALSQSDSERSGQSVVIQNYLCPRGGAGLARVMVINGIADDVFE